MPVVSGVYAIRNTVTGGLYIGSTSNFNRRWAKHTRELRKGVHHSGHLQRAYSKYGSGSWELSVVEYVEDQHKLLEREQAWINFFRPNYNISKFAGSPTRGLKFSDETRKKMSDAQKGRKRAPFTEEHKARISLGKTGKKMSDKALESWRANCMARFTPGYREKWGAVRRGKKLTDEQRKKISLSLMGNSRTRGKKFSSEAYDSRRGPREAKEVPCL